MRQYRPGGHQHGFYCRIQNDLLDRWLVACVGRTLGTIGRETAALVSEDWIGRNEPLPGRKHLYLSGKLKLTPLKQNTTQFNRNK